MNGISGLTPGVGYTCTLGNPKCGNPKLVSHFLCRDMIGYLTGITPNMVFHRYFNPTFLAPAMWSSLSSPSPQSAPPARGRPVDVPRLRSFGSAEWRQTCKMPAADLASKMLVYVFNQQNLIVIRCLKQQPSSVWFHQQNPCLREGLI